MVLYIEQLKYMHEITAERRQMVRFMFSTLQVHYPTDIIDEKTQSWQEEEYNQSLAKGSAMD